MNGNASTNTFDDVKLQNIGNATLVTPGSARKGAGFRDLQNGWLDVTLTQ